MKPFALVTGCSRGIGAAVVDLLLERGWDVVGVSRSTSAATAPRDGFTHVALDLADLAAVQAFADGALADAARFADRPRVGLVNNAGVLEPVAPLSVPAWLAGRFAREAGAAPCRVVSLSSGAASNGYPGWGAYCASKAALAMADEVLAVELDEYDELAGKDVRVFTYAPGVVATRMQETIRATDTADFPRRARFEALHADGELADPAGPARDVVDRLESGDGPRRAVERFEG